MRITEHGVRKMEIRTKCEFLNERWHKAKYLELIFASHPFGVGYAEKIKA